MFSLQDEVVDCRNDYTRGFKTFSQENNIGPAPNIKEEEGKKARLRTQENAKRVKEEKQKKIFTGDIDEKITMEMRRELAAYLREKEQDQLIKWIGNNCLGRHCSNPCKSNNGPYFADLFYGRKNRFITMVSMLGKYRRSSKAGLYLDLTEEPLCEGDYVIFPHTRKMEFLSVARVETVAKWSVSDTRNAGDPVRIDNRQIYPHRDGLYFKGVSRCDPYCYDNCFAYLATGAKYVIKIPTI